MDASSSTRNMRKDFNGLKHGQFLCWPAMTLSTSDVKQVRHRHWQWPPSRKSNRILLCHCGTIIQTICGCYDTVAFYINVTKIYGINIFIALSHYDRYLGLLKLFERTALLRHIDNRHTKEEIINSRVQLCMQNKTNLL